MSDIVLRIDTQSLQTGGKYTLPFVISGLKEKPVLYSVRKVKGNEIWTRIKDRDIDRHPNGECGFVQTFKAKEHGNIPFTFVLFAKGGHRCFCWKASAALNVPKDGGSVSIVVDNKIINNVTGDANAVYQPVDNHNVNITLPESKAATPLSIPFIRKEEFEEHLPIGNRSEKTAVRWKLAFPSGKETVLLTTNPVTVGRSRSHSISIRHNDFGGTDAYLYSSVMSSKPLEISIEKSRITFSHQSVRRICCDDLHIPNNSKAALSVGKHNLLFEYFFPLTMVKADQFTLNDWVPNSYVPPEVLRELLSGGTEETELPPLRFHTEELHPINEYCEEIEALINKADKNADKDKITASWNFFKANPENRYAFRDYYFIGSGVKWTLPNSVQLCILPVNGHLYLLFPNNDTVLRHNGAETDINAAQPILLRDGLEIAVNGTTLFTSHIF